MTKLDAVVAFFRAHPGEWLDGEEFRTVGGRYAYRTRISEARIVRGMRIENRLRRIPGSDACVSEYRYLPPSEPQQSSLFREQESAA